MVQSRSLWQTSASIPAMSGSIWRNRVTLRMLGKMPASSKSSAEDTSSKRLTPLFVAAKARPKSRRRVDEISAFGPKEKERRRDSP